MVMVLCIFVNKERCKLRMSSLIIITLICGLLYFACWISYYVGMVNAIIILGLIIFPCMAFMLFAIDRKNMIAVIPISVFTVCHLIYGVVNFII